MSIADSLEKLATTVGRLTNSSVKLKPSATQRLSKLQKDLPVLPESLLEYLKTTDGDSRLAFPYTFLGASEIVSAYKSLMKRNDVIDDEHPTFGLS